MQKKLLALAVAGALALPGAALAASSVTINGFFKVSYAGIKVARHRRRAPVGRARTAFRTNPRGSVSSWSRIWAVACRRSVRLTGVWRSMPVRMRTSGANWVGLRSKSWGELTMGRHDLHYIYTEDQSYSRGGSLKMTNTSIIAYGNGGANPVANATRTPNVIRWFSPNWKGFTAVVAYSTNPYAAAEADIASSTRKGYRLEYCAAVQRQELGRRLQLVRGQERWCGRASACRRGCPRGLGGGIGGTAAFTAPLEGTSWRVNGHYQWGGLRIGLVWDRSEWE